MRTRRFWGWGYEEEGPDENLLGLVEAGLPALIGATDLRPRPRPRLDEITLRPPRVQPPTSLAAKVSQSPFDRASRSYGKSYRDLVRAFARDFAEPPDFVALPETEADVVSFVDYCATNAIALIPFGGGSSVCGGVEPRVSERFRGVASLDLGRLDRVLEIDEVSLAARIQAGRLRSVAGRTAAALAGSACATFPRASSSRARAAG